MDTVVAVGWRNPFLVTFLLALAARLAALAVLGIRVGGDTSGYLLAAEALRSDPFTRANAFANLPPLYVVVLAVTGGGLPAAMLNVLFGSTIAPLLGIATERHFGKGAGALTAVFVAIEPAFILWTAYLLTDTLALFMLALAIERSSAVLVDQRKGSAALAGASAGLAALARSAYAALFPALLYAHARAARARARTALFVLAVTLVVAVPTLRNALAGVGLTPYRDQGWFLLWAGTTWSERGRGTVGVDIIYPPEHDRWSAAERQTFYRSSVVSFVTERPAEMVGQVVRKSLWFWMPFYPEWSVFHKVWSTAVYCTLYALAALGLWSSWRSRYTRMLLLGIAGAHVTVALTIVDYDARYRLPVELCLLPLAAIGATRLLQRVVSARHRSKAATVRSHV